MNARVNSRIEGAIGWLIFDNAPRRNAVTYDMWRAIPEVLERLSADPDIRIVVLRGAGDAAFISGADVSEFDSKRTTDGLEAYDRVAVLAQESLYGFKKPLIAMLRGFCIGAGVSIAVCCDVRIASAKTRFAIPAGKLGLGYRASGIRKLIDLIGPAKTLDIFYTADQFDAERALSMGLIDHLVDDEMLERYVADYCKRVVENAPLTLAAAKGVVRELLRAGDTYNREHCEALVRRCFESNDYLEGRQAFRQKRKPIFQGC
jgi:enoyl-CoA hydratase/carnithine racemase